MASEEYNFLSNKTIFFGGRPKYVLQNTFDIEIRINQEETTKFAAKKN